MNKFSFSTLIIIALALFSSCEKEVNINLNSGDAKIVVEGQIETGGYPFVVLTKSVGYFSRIDLTTLENSFVRGAIVKVSDGIKTIQLKEYSLDTGSAGNKFSFYSIDTADAAAFSFVGVAERYYTLTVEAEGKILKSVTKIPEVKGVDSMWFKKPGGEPAVETARLMYVKYADPDTLGNYVRYFTRRNSELFLTSFTSTYDDQIINGTTLDSLVLTAGFSRTQEEPNFDSVGYFFKGDTVTLKWSAIDKASFKFFNTLEYAVGSVGNPFASPVNVTSNIQGGGLGVWVGYGVQQVTKVVTD